ncbi:(2Fe-2S)-binding protein [Saccharicrinis aurantiacus]|uniref:(2Fe-2S)-binding protein n=1 Tax=Saccharicrinis aurantiacus TaxID=1849719 RepID=UPI00083911FA|nr:(2Fe-2S)-binding protein [Saccharicrinis aurantiacus]
MLEDNDFACRHMLKKKKDVVKIIQDNNFTTMDEIQDETNIATICGSCFSDIEEILEEEIAKRENK